MGLLREQRGDWAEEDRGTEYGGTTLADGIRMKSHDGTVRRFRVLVEEIR